MQASDVITNTVVTFAPF